MQICNIQVFHLPFKMIYKKNGKVRKVHSLILLPDLEAAQKLAFKLETIGNLHS